ncbi:versicolorin B synthase [Sclerotinia borealis F-4128]|uniref:Versicolorin B synthase n=1 Tax=Sclerotinia borealis (strain F-4128) TaxID=1432307 RepID=W9CMC6_SCLBF|nr:versicolorin B synthase [Sclerotinia borealis F-4128]
MSLRVANATVPAPSREAYSPIGRPLQVSHANWALPISSYAKAAFSSSGIYPLQDLSYGKMMGTQYSPLTFGSPDEKRSSSESSYLHDALASGRDSLKIFTRTLVKKIVFNNKTATGVVVAANGIEWTIEAKKEIIFSAGAVVCLRTLGIEVLIDAPGVGKNMWDHVSISIVQEVSVETQSGISVSVKALKAAQDYDQTHSDILTSSGADYIGKMGKASDPNAVVDASARVIGVNSLRVVDASAFPLLQVTSRTTTSYYLCICREDRDENISRTINVN